MEQNKMEYWKKEFRKLPPKGQLEVLAVLEEMKRIWDEKQKRERSRPQK